jgi:hypothetical protein
MNRTCPLTTTNVTLAKAGMTAYYIPAKATRGPQSLDFDSTHRFRSISAAVAIHRKNISESNPLSMGGFS